MSARVKADGQRDLTRLQANYRARKLWGTRAAVVSHPPAQARYSDGSCRCQRKGCEVTGRYVFVVGVVRSVYFDVKGSGHSWRDAFEQASQKVEGS